MYLERHVTSFLLTVWLSAMGLSGQAAPTPGSCTCITAKDTNGWCEAHGVGYVASVRIRSKMLYETLDAHGHTLDLDTFHCASCRKAIESNGFCEQHRIGFVGRQVYFSRLTYELARGESRDTARIECRVCRRNTESHGWCERCKVGMVGKIAIEDRQAYERVSRAIEILSAASEAAERCEYCAVAMVTDTRCPRCKIAYKDGKPLPSPNRPWGSEPR